MQIEIIGAGRLGRSLNALLKATSHTPTLNQRGPLGDTADVRLLTVPDAEISAVAKELPVGVHSHSLLGLSRHRRPSHLTLASQRCIR